MENDIAENNVFDTVAPAISMAEFGDLERAVGHPLPESFKQHYVHYNGGAPTDTLVPGDDVWEPTDVAMFYSIKHPLPGQDDTSEMLNHFRAMRAKKVIPDFFLPFAWDPGGNFFGLDFRDETVAYYATDVFDPTLSEAENYKKAQRRVAKSFEHFLEILEPNPDASW
ncbi:SMI1/KNR4 family protein [Pseudoduganella sp. HUAS MS19]